MENITHLAERIVTLAPGSPDKETAINATVININYFISDMLKVIKNINETSFSENDKIKRLIDLSDKTGIPLSTLKNALTDNK